MSESTLNNILIREATKDDLSQVFQLVKELALYEKAPKEVTATLLDYEEAFADDIFQALVATHDDKVVGIAVFYMTWSTWKGRMLYLEDFVVRKQFRKFGIGQKLFDAFIDRARELKCSLVKWQVLDWNEPAIAFYEKNHATIEKEWWNGKIVFSK